MPNHQEHLAKGMTYSAAFELLCNQLVQKRIDQLDERSVVEIFLHTFGSCLGAIIPDILEPANNPQHRSFFHSTVFLGFMVYCYQQINVHPTLQEQPGLKKILSGIVFGYITHLLLDSKTPASLPLFR
jgi:membrane-bound metal-dependent hydrolase YbcI (DUF457 family)